MEKSEIGIDIDKARIELGVGSSFCVGDSIYARNSSMVAICIHIRFSAT